MKNNKLILELWKTPIFVSKIENHLNPNQLIDHFESHKNVSHNKQIEIKANKKILNYIYPEIKKILCGHDLIINFYLEIATNGFFHGLKTCSDYDYMGYYFIDVKKTSSNENRNRSGHINLYDPRISAQMIFNPMMLMGKPFNIEPEKDMLWIFPGYLSHFRHSINKGDIQTSLVFKIKVR